MKAFININTFEGQIDLLYVADKDRNEFCLDDTQEAMLEY